MAQSTKNILYHLLGWTTYILVIGLGADEIDEDFVYKNIATIIPLIIVFYVNTLFIFPRYLAREKYLPMVLWILLVCTLTVLIREEISSWLGLKTFYDSITFWNQFRYNLLFVGIGFGYWFAVKNYQQEKYSQQLEKDVSEAKLIILKNQINPHFLYNTLSLLYSKTLPLSAEVAELVGKLSEMMRYSLEEAEENGVVPLEKEVAHLRNFVDINQLRFDNKLNILFEIVGNIGKHRIAPLLLITFVENAFKHGKLNDPVHPLKIQLKVTETEIDFMVENLKATGLKERSSGIGLANVKSRLQLLYPDNHSLFIADGEYTYAIHLKIWKAS